jgi:hypothetical protein
MYKRKRAEPRTEPWGMPDLTSLGGDTYLIPFLYGETHHCLSLKQHLIQLMYTPLMPKLLSFDSSRRWLIWSKALEKSKKSAADSNLLSRSDSI